MLLLTLPVLPPYDTVAVGEFLAARVVPGLERHEGDGTWWTHERPVPLPRGTVVVTVEADADQVRLRVARDDVPDLRVLLARVHRWLDLDAEPDRITGLLAADPMLVDAVRHRPGLRVPTTVDPWETAVRAVIGQQITVRGAGTLLGRLVAAYGHPVADAGGSRRPEGLRAFPAPDVLAAAGPDELARIGTPASRGRTLHALATAVAAGTVSLAGPQRWEARQELLDLPGIGPWTADYIALRALADPDAFPATDLGVRHGARRLGLPYGAKELTAHAERWRPWRAYAAQLLWTVPASPEPDEIVRPL